MSGYNTMQMQQEAAERVRRMQERSRRLVEEHPINAYRGVTLTPPEAEPIQRKTPCSPPNEKVSPPSGGLAALLQGDQEQTLVLLLAVILAKNGAPLELVLALLYVGM